MVALFTVGCGTEASIEEEEATEETTAPYQAPPRDAEEAAADAAKQKAAQQGVKAQSPDSQLEGVECQIAKAKEDLGPEGFNLLGAQWEPLAPGPSVQDYQAQGYSGKEAMDKVQERSGPTLPEFLAEQGYVC